MLIRALGVFFGAALVAVACSEDTEGPLAPATDAGAGGEASSGGSTSGGGDASVGSSPIGASGGRQEGSGAVSSNGGHPVDASTDATDASATDSGSDAAPAPQCLGVSAPCGAEGVPDCCEAYACRLGKCCVPTGIWSNCIANSDCCSGSCIQRQCTCVPLGYSCSGPGQCCSGFACVDGTCICPPDIRGCN